MMHRKFKSDGITKSIITDMMIFLMTLFVLSACSPARINKTTKTSDTFEFSKRIWIAIETKDEFSDKITKMVTIGEVPSDDTLVTRTGNTYPFIGILDGEIYVGVRSGGRYRIPVGTIQMRIDDNTAYTITTDENPIVSNTSMPSYTGINNDIFAQAMQNTTKIMSPFTATSGDKAKAILKEMLHGKVLKYRLIGLNQAISTTGVVVLDSSLEEALNMIGINMSSF